MIKFEKLKALLSHRNPKLSYAELFELLAELALKKLDPEQKIESGKNGKAAGKKEDSSPSKIYQCEKFPVSTPPAESDSHTEKSRHISRSLRSAVWKRDQGKCTYVNDQTGVCCESTRLLEVHHREDFSLGGEHTMENLTLRCRTHNLHAAVQTFGIKLMNHYLRE